MGLQRCYLGYEYKLGDRLTMKGVMDFGRSADVDDHQRIGYLKYAMVSWKTANLTLNGGLIPTTQFHFQEKFWGCRYIRKSFQDEYFRLFRDIIKYGWIEICRIGIYVYIKVIMWRIQ